MSKDKQHKGVIGSIVDAVDHVIHPHAHPESEHLENDEGTEAKEGSAPKQKQKQSQSRPAQDMASHPKFSKFQK